MSEPEYMNLPEVLLARKGMNALRLEVPEAVANDLNALIFDAFKAIASRISSSIEPASGDGDAHGRRVLEAARKEIADLIDDTRFAFTTSYKQGVEQAIGVIDRHLSDPLPPLASSPAYHEEEPVAWLITRPNRDGIFKLYLPLLRSRDEMETYRRNNPEETLQPLFAKLPKCNGAGE